MFQSPTDPPLSPPSTPILVLGGGVFTKRTEVLDISGEKCSARIPKINRNVRGVGSANLQSVYDTLVLCNIRIGGPEHLCMGAKKNSNSWVVLPPKLPAFTSSGASVVIDNDVILIGDKILRISINKETVLTGSAPPPPNEDVFGSGCAVYDKARGRILYVNQGKIFSLDDSLDMDWVLESSLFFEREAVGCNILTIGGRRQLWVAGGKGDSEGFAKTIVEFIDMDELSEKEPKVIDKMILGHVRPGITQVEEDVYVVGGVQKFRSSRFIEKWNGDFWEVSPLACTKFGLQNNMNAVFLEKEFCET